MLTRDTIRSVTLTLDSSLFDQMLASSGNKPIGEHPFLGSILELIAHGTPIYIRRAGGPDVARLDTRNGLLFVQSIPNDRNG